MISIIVPVYKVEKYLPKCIESLLNQTYRDIQIILIDDGSPDNSGQICDRYSAKDRRITTIHQPNLGVSAARNAGLNIAQGDYIGFCDPDDFVAPEMYKRMEEAMRRYEVDLAACGYDYYDEQYRIDKSRSYVVRTDEILDKELIYNMMADMPPTIRHGVVTKLFRRSLIGDLRFDSHLHSSEDAEFFLDYVQRIDKAVFIHEPLYKNLVRHGSATHGALNIRSLRDSFRVHDRMYQETIRNYPHLKKRASAFLLDVCTLKYNESRSKANGMDPKERRLLRDMRNYIRRKAIGAIFNREINWKTRLYYMLLWIRK